MELAPLPSPGFYSRLFLVMKASGSWRLVIDLSVLNLCVLKTPFKMETLQSVLLSVQKGDWMVSLDLKDVYLQVPIHPDSRKYLRFVAFSWVYQFKALCFGLSTASQVFTRVMAPVSTFLHRAGIQICRYLDDWLIQASSPSLILQALETVLCLCQSFRYRYCSKLGEVSSRTFSEDGVPRSSSGFGIFQGFSLPAESGEALINWKRILSCDAQPAASWCVLLGVLSSLTPLVPGSRLWMRSLRLLHCSWDQKDNSVLVRWDLACRQDLDWGLVRSRLEKGVPLAQVSPNLDFWSDASDVGWGTHLGDDTASGLWSPEEAVLSINAKELLALERGLLQFAPLISGSTVAIFVNNSTAVAYLRKQGGTRSPVLNYIAQRILCWAESLHLVLAPQFIKGKNNVLADSVQAQSDPGVRMDFEVGGISGSSQDVAGDDRPVCHLVESRLFTIFFALPRSEGLRYGCFSSELGWLSGVGYAFPPWSLIILVLKKLRSSCGVLMTLITPLWPQRP